MAANIYHLSPTKREIIPEEKEKFEGLMNNFTEFFRGQNPFSLKRDKRTLIRAMEKKLKEWGFIPQQARLSADKTKAKSKVAVESLSRWLISEKSSETTNNRERAINALRNVVYSA